MHKYKSILPILCAVVVSYSQDLICLRDGMCAKANILDTAGCKISYERNGNKISIAKDLINFIVISSDTISLSSFVCLHKDLATPPKIYHASENNVTSPIAKADSPEAYHPPNPAAAIFGATGICAGVLGLVLTIFDANSAEKINTGSQTIEYNHDWTIGHTIGLSLSIGIISTGIGTIVLWAR